MATCADVLLDRLEDAGVDSLFGLPGPRAAGLHRALSRSRVRLVSTRLEEGAISMADGYARASGRPGVCVASDPEMLLRAAAALVSSGADRPLLVVSSSPGELCRDDGRGRSGPSPSALTRLLSEIGASTESISDASALPEALSRILAVLTGPRPGPIHLRVPDALWNAPADLESEPRAIFSRCAPDVHAVDLVRERLCRARRPVGLLGDRAVGAGSDFLACCERIDAPFALTPSAKGVVPEDHPLCVGVVSVPGEAGPLLERADLVLAVGTSRGCDAWIRDVEGDLIWVDDDSPPRSGAPSTLHLAGDPDLALASLNDSLSRSERSARLRLCGQSRATAVRHRGVSAEEEDASRRCEHVVATVRAALPDDGIVVADDSELGRTATRQFRVRQPRSWVTSGRGGARHALPAAIGAKLAEPGREVACITGDCGLLASLAELATAVELQLPIAVVVWNNSGRRGVRERLGREGTRAIGVDLFTPFLRTVAAGFACHADRVESLGHLRKILEESFDRDMPTLIEIREDEAYLDCADRARLPSMAT